MAGVSKVFATGILKGRIAVVTGGSRGIGRSASLVLARGGARLVVGYHRDAQQTLLLVHWIILANCAGVWPTARIRTGGDWPGII